MSDENQVQINPPSLGITQEIGNQSVKNIISSFYNKEVFSQIKTLAETAYISGIYGKKYTNATQAFMVLLAGLEMGESPVYSLQNLYIVAGSVNTYGKATTARLTKFGYQIQYIESTQDKCICVVTKPNTQENYTETVEFHDFDNDLIKQDEWIDGRKTGNKVYKVGWLPGNNRKLKLRYHALNNIIKTYIPQVLGMGGIVEAEEDFVTVEAQDVTTKTKEVDKVEPTTVTAKGDLAEFLAKSKTKTEETAKKQASKTTEKVVTDLQIEAKDQIQSQNIEESNQITKAQVDTINALLIEVCKTLYITAFPSASQVSEYKKTMLKTLKYEGQLEEMHTETADQLIELLNDQKNKILS